MTLGVLLLPLTLGACNHDPRRASKDESDSEESRATHKKTTSEAARDGARAVGPQAADAREEDRETREAREAREEARAELAAAARNAREALEKAAQRARSTLEDVAQNTKAEKQR